VGSSVSGGFDPVLFEQFTNSPSPLAQGAAQTQAQAIGTSGAINLSAAVVTILSQSAQPLYSPTL
jgi:hypothetical protein